jgi:hypothetical protein
MIFKKQRHIINDSIFILIALILFSCEIGTIEADINKNKIIGSIDSLSINKRMHEHSFMAPSITYYVSVYNIDTVDYKILIPYDAPRWQWRQSRDVSTPYLWLFTEPIDTSYLSWLSTVYRDISLLEHIGTCHEAVIFDYLGENDTIITVKDKQNFTINPYRCSLTIPEFYNMYEIISDYEKFIFGDFHLKMLNLYNGDTIIFNKSNHFKVKYICDGIEFFPLDSVKMNERIIIGGIIDPPGDILSNKAFYRATTTAKSKKSD